MDARVIFPWVFLVCLSIAPFIANANSNAVEKGGATAFSMSIPSGTLTLLAAQQKALNNSPTISQTLSRIQAAQAVVDQTRSTWRPMLSMNAGYRLQQSSVQPDWLPEQRVQDSFSHWSAGVQANWVIFDGFRRKAMILAAQYKVEHSQHLSDEARRLLAEAVASAYYRTQLAQEKMSIAQQNQIFNRSLEREAAIRWQAGSIAKADKLNFSVRALQAESDFLIAEQQFKIAITVLAELMALPATQWPHNLIPTRNTQQILAEPVPRYQEESTYALQHHPSLQALNSSLAELEQRKLEQKGQYWPKAEINSGINYHLFNDMGTIDQEEHDRYAGINLTWELYAGGERAASIRETGSLIRATYHQQQQQVLAIQSAIQQAIDNSTARYAVYQRQQAALDLTARIREHIKKSYRAGHTSITRLNEAQTDLVRAAGAEATSRINYQFTLQQLQAASGRILTKEGL